MVYYIFLKIKSSIINKSTSADKCRVSNKAIQRDISDLRSYFSEVYSLNGKWSRDYLDRSKRLEFHTVIVVNYSVIEKITDKLPD